MAMKIGRKKKENLPLEGELAEIDFILRGGDKVDELAHLGLVGRLVEDVEEIGVVRLRAEVGFEQMVDGALEHEGVVHRDQTDLGLLVPAGLSSAGDGSVHHVVRDEEVSLELVDIVDRGEDMS